MQLVKGEAKCQGDIDLFWAKPCYNTVTYLEK